MKVQGPKTYLTRLDINEWSDNIMIYMISQTNDLIMIDFQ